MVRFWCDTCNRYVDPAPHVVNERKDPTKGWNYKNLIARWDGETWDCPKCHKAVRRLEEIENR